MTTHFKKPWMVAILGGLMLSAGAVLAANRPAEQILSDIDAVKLPQYDGTKRGDQIYVRDFMTKRQEAASKRAKLIFELYKAAPEHERMATLMPERWGSMSPIGPQAEELSKEINDVAAHAVSPKLKLEATYYQAQLALFNARSSGTFDMSGVEAFIKLAPRIAAPPPCSTARPWPPRTTR